MTTLTPLPGRDSPSKQNPLRKFWSELVGVRESRAQLLAGLIGLENDIQEVRAILGAQANESLLDCARRIREQIARLTRIPADTPDCDIHRTAEINWRDWVPGDKAQYLGRHGMSAERAECARRGLAVGDVYVVSRVVVSHYSTRLFFHGRGNNGFNSVCFEKVT